MPRRDDTFPARLDVRLTEEQRSEIAAAAERAGLALSQWCRDRLLRAARAEVAEQAPARRRAR